MSRLLEIKLALVGRKVDKREHNPRFRVDRGMQVKETKR
jgi:hypothetical protein